MNINDCSTNSCKNGATCHDLLGTFNCTCAPGFEGRTCDVDINECARANLCMNGGTCVNLIGSSKCVCKGYEGPRCERDINECESASYPCQNGRCFNTNGSFGCECFSNFIGDHCETETVSLKFVERAVYSLLRTWSNLRPLFEGMDSSDFCLSTN